MDPRVKAVRADEMVGEGSCTSIDECWTDEELIEYLDEEGITTPEGAVKFARESEGLFREKEREIQAEIF